MALQLRKELKNGMAGDYWRIIQTKTDYVSGKITIVLGLYKDKAQREAGDDNFFHTEVFRVFGSDMQRQDMYARVKVSQKDGEGHETNEWADAKDI